MSQMDTNDTTSVADTLKLRNTETSALKRMPTGDNMASSASAAARKTIKLKPLTPQMTGVPTEEDPSSMAVASPLIKKVGVSASPAAPGEEAAPPQFMSTATAPVARIPNKDRGAASAAPPASGVSSVSAPFSAKVNTGTASIPRLNLTPKTSPATPSPSAMETIQLSPGKTTAAPAGKGVTTASGSIPKYVATSTSALPKTSVPPPTPGQAPKYVSTATSPIPSAAASGANADKNAPLKDAISQAKIQSGMQGAKPAIKLRPSANPDGPATGGAGAPGAPTIRLVPQTESGVTPLPPAANAAPPKSSDTMTAKISRKGVASSAKPVTPGAETLQLKPSAVPEAAAVSASAPTVELATGIVEDTQKALASQTVPATPAAPATASDPGVTTKIPRKLGLKKTEQGAAPTVAAAQSAPTVAATPAVAAAPTDAAAPATPAAPALGKKTAPTLREQEVIAKVNLQVSDQEGAQTLEMGSVENKVEQEFVKKKKRSGEPHIFFAVCVIIAFAVTLFTVYTLVAHYLNTWEGKKLPVIVFEQIDEHMKKK